MRGSRGCSRSLLQAHTALHVSQTAGHEEEDELARKDTPRTHIMVCRMPYVLYQPHGACHGGRGHGINFFPRALEITPGAPCLNLELDFDKTMFKSMWVSINSSAG